MTRVIDVGDEGWECFHTEIDHIEEGWLTFFQTLAFAVARHPGEPRRTVFGMGLLPGDPLAALGLAVDAARRASATRPRPAPATSSPAPSGSAPTARSASPSTPGATACWWPPPSPAAPTRARRP